MNESPEPCQRRPHTEPDGHSIEFAREVTSADLFESAMWPYLPFCAARAISMTLLLVMAVGVFATFSRGAHAQSTEVLISNGEPPPSARLLLVNLTRRHVAQEFTTGPHPAGHDVHAVAETNVGAAADMTGAVFRPSRRTGAVAVSYASANHMFAVPAGAKGESVPRPRWRGCLPACASLTAYRSRGGTLAGATTADPSRAAALEDWIQVRRVVSLDFSCRRALLCSHTGGIGEGDEP